MTEYHINKGTGKVVEFMGLRAQYFTAFFLGIIFAIVLIFTLRIFLPMLLIGTIVVVALGTLAWYCFTFNKKYGQFGLQKKQARGYAPKFVYNRKSFFLMLTVKKNV
ncbi:MAG: DUF4133 domain-containing protein [Prevotellaceae bacterium]|jgi:hypothetical protein|nr:DUF4133 domain-containing protein [Prevotellaceae bacterium]